jgi:hypothetical protein
MNVASLPSNSPSGVVSQSIPDDSASTGNRNGVTSTGSDANGNGAMACDGGVDEFSLRPSDVDMNQTNILVSENATGNSSSDDSVPPSDVQAHVLHTQGSTYSMIEEGWFKSAQEESETSSASSQTSNDSVNNKESSPKNAPDVESQTSNRSFAGSGDHASNCDSTNAAASLDKKESTDSARGKGHSKTDPSINHDDESDASFDCSIFRSSDVGMTKNMETRPTKSFASTISDKENGTSPIPSKGIDGLKDSRTNSADIKDESCGKSPSKAADTATLNEIVDLCSSDSDDDDRKEPSPARAAEARAKVSSDDTGSVSLSCSNSSNNGIEFLHIGQEVTVNTGKREHDATIVSIKDGWAEVKWSWGKATELVPINSIKKSMLYDDDGYSKRNRKKPELFTFSSSLKTEESTKMPAKKKAKRASSTGCKHVGSQNRPIISSKNKIDSVKALNVAVTPSHRKPISRLTRKESSEQLAGSVEDKSDPVSLEKVSAVAPSSRNQREKNANEAYYRVEGILDRRETPYDKGSKCFVEYRTFMFIISLLITSYTANHVFGLI